MKEKIVVMQKDDRLYIRSVDVKKLKPLLSFANINVHRSQEGKHTGVPQYYIQLTQAFNFLQTVKDSYSVTFL